MIQAPEVVLSAFSYRIYVLFANIYLINWFFFKLFHTLNRLGVLHTVMISHVIYDATFQRDS